VFLGDILDVPFSGMTEGRVNGHRGEEVKRNNENYKK
jgi:hypothetical protein